MIKLFYFVLIVIICNPVNSNKLLRYLDLVDLGSWARKLSDQEKGEEEGILYDDYGSSDESEGILAYLAVTTTSRKRDLAANFFAFTMCYFFSFAEEEGSSFEDVEHNENILTLSLIGKRESDA